jgi:tRNA A-37 threonylcarbamoyl transferase component Bud32
MVDDPDEGSDKTRVDSHAATVSTPLPEGEPPSRYTPPALEVSPGSRYRFGEVLGEGGMGEVVQAFDQQIGRDVAVKRIRADKPSAEQVARFVREARVQARLEHPAVVPVHDIAVDRAGKPFFVMKRLAGTEVKDLLERLRIGLGDPVQIRRRLLRAFVDVCLAVEFAHARGIVHRDLKPANIMLGEYGEVYVLDWGIARAVSDTEESAGRTGDLALATGETRAGAILGTPAYMAPEQLVGERVGPAADVYSLGCVLYEIVAGEPLHQPNRSVVTAILAADARPSKRRPDAPPELDAICDRATQTDPAARYPSARGLGEAVQAFLDGDRDIAARKELAQRHVEEARVAHANGDRKTAMRAAGRALALDPTVVEAAQLVTRLMLEPPSEVPGEVERQLELLDVAAAKAQGRIGTLAIAGYLFFVPLLWWTGVRDWTVIAAFATTAAVSAVQIYAMSLKQKIPVASIYASAVINAVLIGLVSRIVGPFMIAPTLVLTTLMAFAVHPMFGRTWIIATVLTLGLAVPWLLEGLGVLAPTYRFEAGTIVLTSPTVTFSAVPVQLALALIMFWLVLITAVLLRTMGLRQRDAAKRIELQAWHLRQLVSG